MAPSEDAAAASARPALASLTLSSAATQHTAAARRVSSSRSGVRAVRALPPLGARRSSSSNASARAARLAAAAASSSTTHKQQQQQQRKAGGGSLRPWALPLAAAGLALHVARAAAKHVSTAPREAGRQGRALGTARVVTSLLPKRISGGGASPPAFPGGRKPALVWFRNDLRLHDHEPLSAAVGASTSVLPVYIFDPREYGKSRNGFDKTGPYRARFILEALADLRSRLRDAGSDLILRVGRPEDVLPQLCRAVGGGAVYCHGEVTAEDGRVEAAVRRALDKAGAALKVMWGGTLFHLEDLPFQLPAMPPHYSDFRKAVRSLSVRAPVEAPATIKGLPAATLSPGELPSLQQLGFDAATLNRCAADTSAGGANLRGGESEALRRLSDFVSHFVAGPAAAASPSSSAAAAGGSSAGGTNFCCKISPWLALGCLSPRQLFGQLQQRLAAGKQQQAQVAAAGGDASDADMQWLLYELLWRDFFRFVTKKYAVVGPAGAAAAAAAGTGAAAMA